MLHKPPSKNLRVGRVWSKTKSNSWMVLCLASPQHMLNSIVQELSNCRQLQQLCCSCWDHQCLRISPVSWYRITCMMILIVSHLQCTTVFLSQKFAQKFVKKSQICWNFSQIFYAKLCVFVMSNSQISSFAENRSFLINNGVFPPSHLSKD